MVRTGGRAEQCVVHLSIGHEARVHVSGETPHDAHGQGGLARTVAVGARAVPRLTWQWWQQQQWQW